MAPPANKTGGRTGHPAARAAHPPARLRQRRPPVAFQAPHGNDLIAEEQAAREEAECLGEPVKEVEAQRLEVEAGGAAGVKEHEVAQLLGADVREAPELNSDAEEEDRPQHNIDQEILAIALPTLATLAADPVAALVSTSFVGRLGATELASVGVALSVFNSVTKLFNMPLLSVTTSTVASALGEMEEHHSRGERISAAASSSILLALLIGAFQALLLGVFGVAGLGLWGVGPTSPLAPSAVAYLTIRALAAPAGVLFLTLQGTFRGLGDTRAPFWATLLMNTLNIGLEYALIWQLGWGVRGAALAMVAAQAVSAAALLAVLRRRCSLGLASSGAIRETLRFLKPTGLLVLRTVATTATFACATAIAARTDAVHTASHQIAFQVWLASSLLADSLAVAAQALMARSLAAGDKPTARRVVWRCLGLSLSLGLALMAGLALGRDSLAGLFTQDAAVRCCMRGLLPLVFITQPVNALAFVMDGVLFGVQGYAHAARAMLIASAPAIACMIAGAQLAGGQMDATLTSVWVGLAIFMFLRFATLFVPMLRRMPPFDVLHD